jgi:two-component system response regulator VicR
MLKILVVDDDAEVAKALLRVLQRANFEVEIAVDGPQALEALARSTPNFVISDFKMPGMNGAELVREVRRRHPKMPCLILTGYADLADSGSDVIKIMTKPWDRKLLVAHILEELCPESPTRSS